MIKQTFEEVFTFEALYRAHMKGRNSKRDKKPLVRFEMTMLNHLYDIYDKILNGKFRFGNYSAFVVYEPKKREIQTLHYSARIVQHVICDDVLMPYFSKRAILDNCVCQVGKGSHFALRRFENMLRAHIRRHGVTGYILKCDILKYFPSMPHKQMKEVFCNPIKDKRLRAMIEGVIDSYHTHADYLNRYSIPPLGNSERGTERGVPIGNQTSQVFGMYYLNAVDRFVKEKLRCKVYSRYMDDFVLVHEDKTFVQNALAEIKKIVASLGLFLNSKTQIFPIKNGVTYLGFRYVITPEGKIIKTVKKRTRTRMRWRARYIKKAYFDGAIDSDRVQMSLSAFHGHLKFGNTYKLRKELFDRLSALVNDDFKLRKK
ncbi:MAG: RNA-directed DNA polymerase, partial [Clostridia bacterium]|nr:RNA-directed DNA polymerase [Clostridia bacterium]